MNSSKDLHYKSSSIFPSYILNDSLWTDTNAIKSAQISSILILPYSERSADQMKVLIKWVMSVWKVAETMGFKKCHEMSKSLRSIYYDR